MRVTHASSRGDEAVKTRRDVESKLELSIPHSLVTTDSTCISRPPGRIVDLMPNALTCIVKRLRRNGKDGGIVDVLIIDQPEVCLSA